MGIKLSKAQLVLKGYKEAMIELGSKLKKILSAKTI